MKKRFLLPLLLVGSLTACGGGSGGGLVTGGKQYKEGDAANVDSALREAKEGKLKKVTVSEKVDFTYKMSAQGQSYSMSEKLDGKAVVDLEEETMEATFKVTASEGGQSQSANVQFKVAKDEAGGYSLISGSYSGGFDEEGLEEMFEMASYTVYSWNYAGENGFIEQMAEAGSGYGSAVAGFVQEVLNNLVIAGDPATGTFDVGLGKAVKLDYQGITFSFNKLKYSYKDCLLKDVVFGLKGSGNYSAQGVSASVNINETAEMHYSYEFKA